MDGSEVCSEGTVCPLPSSAKGRGDRRVLDVVGRRVLPAFARVHASARLSLALRVSVLPLMVGVGTIGGRSVELDAEEIRSVSCAVAAVPSVTGVLSVSYRRRLVQSLLLSSAGISVNNTAIQDSVHRRDSQCIVNGRS